MATLRDVVAYLCYFYPHKNELSKARLTKMVYLADWKSAIERGCQITSIEWEFTHYGPYVEDVVNLALFDDDFEIELTSNYYGSPKEVMHFLGEANDIKLDAEEESILDFVIESTKSKYWNDFIRLVYSTYPIINSPRYSRLDLVSLAGDYKEELSRDAWDRIGRR